MYKKDKLREASYSCKLKEMFIHLKDAFDAQKNIR